MNLKKNPELIPLVEWWEKDGKQTVVWLLVAAIAVGGWYGWKNHRVAMKAAAADAVVNAYTTEEIEEAVSKFSGTAAAGALRLIFILGAVEEPLGHVHDGAVAGVQGQEEATEDADDGAAQLGEQADKDLAQQAAQGAAGLQLFAGGPQGLNKCGVPGQDLAEQPVKHH